MTQQNINMLDETEPGYGQLFAILMRRRFWLLGVMLGTLGVAALLTLKAKPTYQSSMQLLVESSYQGKKREGSTENQFADSNIEIDSATQLNLMRSSQLLGKAINLVKKDYPDLTIEEVKKSLILTQLRDGKQETETKIFQAIYTADDAQKSQKILEAIEDVYLEYNREQQKQRLSKGLEFIDQQIPKQRDSLVQSEISLERFRKKQNFIQPELQVQSLTTSLSNIEQERRTIRAQYQDYLGRYQVLQQQLGTTPQEAIVSSRLSQSTRYQALLNEIQKTELALEQQRLRFLDNSPMIQQLQEQRQRQLALLQQEISNVLGQSGPVTNRGTESLLKKGQLGSLDIKVADQLLESQTMLAGLQERDRSLAQKEQQIRAELTRFPSIMAEYGRLLPDVQIKRAALEELMKARQELGLEIARKGFDWQVVEEPQLGLKTGPNLRINLMLGLVAGLMLGGLAAFLRETVDDAVQSSDDLKKQVALPLLGMAPNLPPARANEPMIELPFGKPQVLAPWTIQVINAPPSWEALDLIYKNIQLLNSLSAFKSLMFTSALAGEGKSTIALGLAISAARLHQRVLLIDADLRNPSLHKKLNLPNEQGLSTLLVSDAHLPISKTIQSSGSYIDILTSGPAAADPANLLSSPRMGELITAFEQDYDLVLVDAPPVLGMVDAMLAGSFCSGVVLVARIGKVTRTELTEATAMLNKLNLIGVVANETTASYNAYPKLVNSEFRLKKVEEDKPIIFR